MSVFYAVWCSSLGRTFSEISLSCVFNQLTALNYSTEDLTPLSYTDHCRINTKIQAANIYLHLEVLEVCAKKASFGSSSDMLVAQHLVLSLVWSSSLRTIIVEAEVEYWAVLSILIKLLCL